MMCVVLSFSLLGCATAPPQIALSVPDDAGIICGRLVQKVYADYQIRRLKQEWDIDTSGAFLADMLQNKNMIVPEATWSIMISARRLALRLESARTPDEVGEALIEIKKSCTRGIWRPYMPPRDPIRGHNKIRT